MGPSNLLPSFLHRGARDLLDVGADARARVSPEENGTRWMSFTGCVRLACSAPGDVHLVDELLALQRRHAAHAFAVRDADAVEIRIFLEHLRDALAQVAFRDVRGVAGT